MWTDLLVLGGMLAAFALICTLADKGKKRK